VSTQQVSIGLDIGGTKIAGGLMNAQGDLLEQQVFTTAAAEGGPVVFQQMLAVVDEFVRRSAALGLAVIGVGVATPGVVDVQTGTVTYASNNIPGWSGTPIGAGIRERFALPAWADNDGNVALVGELSFGAGRGVRDALMITLGTGIGGSVAVDGQILRGAHGSAGKFGHVPVSRSGPVCSCGRRGCVEAYASGPAIAREAGRQFGFAGTAEELVTLARDGDAGAVRVFRRAGERLGMAIAAAVNLLDPGLCLVSGGLTAAGSLLLEPARRVMATKCHPTTADRTRLEMAALGPKAGLLGAAYLPWNPRVLG